MMLSEEDDYNTADEDHLLNTIDEQINSSTVSGVLSGSTESFQDEQDFDSVGFQTARNRLGERNALGGYAPLGQEMEALLSSDHSSDDGDQVVSAATYTVEDAVENMGFGWFQIKIFFICGMFAATDALEMLLLSVLAPVLRCEWHLTEMQVAFVTTVVFAGMFAGSAVWGSWSDKYGRKSVMMIAAVWILYFGILTAFSPTYSWILILRCLVGCGFGGAVQSFTLFAEYLPSKYRAKVLIIYNIMWAAGSCFEILMAYFVMPTIGWRYLVGFSALPMIITVFCVQFCPESARYLLAAGKISQAKDILVKATKLNGKDLPPGTLVASKITERGNPREMFVGKFTRTTLILWFLWFAVAFSYYGVVLLNAEMTQLQEEFCGHSEEKVEGCQCHLLTSNEYVHMIISTFGEFCAIPFNLLTIDWLGRKITLMSNFIGATLFFMLLQICVSTNVLTVFIFGVRAFASGLFNTVYIYTSEVYPTNVRSLGLGTCSAAARIGAMVTPFIAQVLLEASPRGSIYVYGGTMLLCTVATFFLPIETKGRELLQSER